MKLNRREAVKIIAGAVPALASSSAFAASPQASVRKSATDAIMRFAFDGVFSEFPIAMTELGQQSPTNLSAYSHLVMEMRMSSPQRLLSLGQHKPRAALRIDHRVRAERVAAGVDSVTVLHRPGFAGQRSRPRPRTGARLLLVFRMGTVRGSRIRRVDWHRDGVSAQQADGRTAQRASVNQGRRVGFLEAGPMLDSFGQWAYADWPRKIKSHEAIDARARSGGESLRQRCGIRLRPLQRLRRVPTPRPPASSALSRSTAAGGSSTRTVTLFLSTGINGTPGGGARIRRQ